MVSCRIAGCEFSIEEAPGAFEVSLEGSEEEKGIALLHLRLTADKPSVPAKLQIKWSIPCVDIHSTWNPVLGFSRELKPDFPGTPIFSCKSKATSGAPVQELLSYSGENRLTIAVSDAMNPIKISSGLNEETARIFCRIFFFSETACKINRYEAVIRLDFRKIPYYESLDGVQKWWSSLPGYQPASIPEYTKLPVYSTWYSFHQHVDPEKILRQCILAKEIGCESVIVDDGWQTDNNSRGYSYCGDWKPAGSKVKDMREFVTRVHSAGLKFLLWYSVPFMGVHSEAWKRFEGKFLGPDFLGANVLDPRFPEVREYLIGTYENALKEWDLDGLKLDFVDSFRTRGDTALEFGGGRDYDSVDEAADRLLKESLKRLRRIKPDFTVEFRQSYIGPLMKTYGNMFRAGDCPNDSLSNRLSTIDIRLLCGSCATHSDMLMWNAGDSAESAAMQIINILYSVPQISVMIDSLPERHYKMLKFWLDFWRRNKEVLLNGKFCPMHPEANYSGVTAYGRDKLIATAYSSPLITLPEGRKFKEIILVNGSLEEGLILKAADTYEKSEYILYNCCGEAVKSGTLTLSKGLNSFDVPAAGMAVIKF